ncbi:hypothetical protein [Buttiauxella noackiae]|uniref:hypothetical protein n=1 Tax=Buttiauxella noackiae TaxID=82992 RepID=UPI00054DAFD9|nr:hypothetical protein [Buttiauxella noackiae]
MLPIETPLENGLYTDIFVADTGSFAISTNLTGELRVNDPTFHTLNNVVAPPTLGVSRSVTEVETYDSDETDKLIGEISVDDIELLVYKVIGDAQQQILADAIEHKQTLRFRNMYHLDHVQGNTSSVAYYQVFEGIPVEEMQTGGDDAPTLMTYRIAVTDRGLAGVMRVGSPVLTGDFGIGAGTVDFPGVHDTTRLTGNRFLQFPASDSSNPFGGADTAGIALQGSENSGYQLVVNSSGLLYIRVRTVRGDGTLGDWVTVYTSAEKPTAKALGVVALDGSLPMTGKLTAPTVQVQDVLTKRVQADEKIEIGVPGARDQSASLLLHGSDDAINTNNWQVIAGNTKETHVKRDELGFIGNNGLTPTLKLCTNGNAYILHDAFIGNDLRVTGATFNLGSAHAARIDSETVVYSDSIHDVQIRTTSFSGWNGLTVSNDEGMSTAFILNTRNYQEYLNSTYLRLSGGILTGELSLPHLNITADSLPGITLRRTGTSTLANTNVAVIEQDNNGRVSFTYRNASGKTDGVVTIDSGKSGEVYHTGNKPSAADIGAIDIHDVIDLGYL